jgi:5-methylcytosine-specific restriction endonuclease McrA
MVFMGKKDDTRYRRRQKKDFFDFAEPNSLAVEKQKARKLRHSSWWKQKIADGECYYCRKSFDAAGLTMDHVVPLSRGGKSEKNNLVCCCKECNNKKKHLLPMEWDEYLNGINKK